MGSLFEVLTAREAAVGARVEELTVLIVELTGQLETERERLSRLVVTRETLTELAAEGSGLVELPEAPVQRPAASSGPAVSPGPAGVSAPRPAPGPVVGVLTVPHREPGMSTGALPSDYRDIVEVVTDAPAPIRAKQVVPRVGLAVSAAKIEGTRSKLKRLVERGWLAEEVPGLFTPVGGGAGREPVDSGAADDPVNRRRIGQEGSSL